MARHITKDWFSIINECRKSGLSNRLWCHQKQISYSTFYYHVKRLHKEACELPQAQRKCSIPVIQEVVPLCFEELSETPSVSDERNSFFETAVTLQFKQVTICIANHANTATISNTLRALQELC